MRQIFPLEFVGKEELDFDLYDDKGQIIYEAGEMLTPGIFMKLCHIKIYINEEHSDYSSFENNHGKLKHKSIIPDKVEKTLKKISRNILRNVRNNEIPNVSICNEAADIIVEEVNNNLEKIECISQLKIFDEYTYSHSINVSTLSCALAMELGFEQEEIKELALGALLHDIGKMLIPNDILNKPAMLDEDEFEIVKSHSLLGYKYIVDKINLPDKIAKVALDHQENYSGGGYPNGLKGKEINLFAQIAAIVDVYDALTSNKVYKHAVDSDKAIDIMISECNNRFNPYIMHKFMQLVDCDNKKPINFNKYNNDGA